MEKETKSNIPSLFIKKVASPIAVITAIVLGIDQILGALNLLKYVFDNVGTNGQIVIFIIVGISLIYFVVQSIIREERIIDLKAERDSLQERLRSKETELKQIEEYNFRLAEETVKEDIWRRDVIGAPPFVGKKERRARFISLLNLKGGVGKTTLTANLGVTLALMDRPLRVLLIDLDFQASLSNMSVEASALLNASRAGNTTSKLLSLSCDLNVDIFRNMLVGVNGVDNACIVIADVPLERKDFEMQARYFLDPKKEVRFLFRSILHKKEITNEFDVVLFDCPPRLTTSTVNALTTSDYILIPTKLDEPSFEAIPRTLTFIEKLRTIAQPKILGVVANEVRFWRRPQLIKAHQNGMSRLKELVYAHDPDLYVFKSVVELSTEVAFNREKSRVPSVDANVRQKLFYELAVELRQRIGK